MNWGRLLCALGWHRWEMCSEHPKEQCCSRESCLGWRPHPAYKREWLRKRGPR